jgi:hypothetical protein
VRTLSSTQLVSVWERGQGLHPVDRGLLVLGAALPEVPHATLAGWPVGRRNRALAEWLSLSLGPHLVDALALLEPNPTEVDARVEVAGHAFRLPTSRDLALIARENDSHDAVARLLEACRLDDDGELGLTGDEVDELGERFALADPLAETRLTLSCPECGAEWEETLDLTAFAWAEVESRAKRLLFEVHQLASAYGWSETDVLAVSEPRRAFYLEAAGG